MAQIRRNWNNNNWSNSIFCMTNVMYNKSFKIASAILGVLFFGIIAVLSFYIVHNAQWLVGDDAIIINRTGWDIPFSIWDTIKPELGRFFPLAYMHENLVLLFSGTMHSATQHYVVNMTEYIVLTISILVILWRTIKPQSIWDLLILFFTVFLAITKVYTIYLNVFSTLYNYYTICILSIMFMVLFYHKQKILYGILSCVGWTYSVFCIENAFVLPLTIGLMPLILNRKSLTKQTIVYHITLILISISYLVIYYLIVYRHTNPELMYDPSHGTNVTFFANAVNILKGQKFLILAICVWLYRQVMLLQKKDQYHILYDTLLWASGAVLFAGLILKLDWQMYYYTSILCSFTSVVYMLNKYLDKKIVCIVVLLFALLHSYKIPKQIDKNQDDRIETAEEVNTICIDYANNINIVWYDAPANDSTLFELNLREFKKSSLRSYIRYNLKDSDWDYANKLSTTNDNIILYPIYNDAFALRPNELRNLPYKSISNILIYTIPAHHEYTIQ